MHTPTDDHQHQWAEASGFEVEGALMCSICGAMKDAEEEDVLTQMGEPDPDQPLFAD